MDGQTLSGQAAAAFARTYAIPTVFFELGNLDSKLFMDPDGVNGGSRVAQTSQIVNDLDASDKEIETWTQHFVERRLKAGPLPQAKCIRKISPWFPIDWIGDVLLRIPQPLNVSLRKRFLSKCNAFRIRKCQCHEPLKPYVFLPLQVSTDSNLLLFSNYDNIEAIRYAAERSREIQCNLVVKPHPAEQDLNLIRKVTALCREGGYTLTSHNTTELVFGATEVITINSTVGLKAILYGKKVTLLGRSVYESFSKHQAGAYVLRYLVDFNPFGTDAMSTEILKRVLAVADTHR